MKSKKLLWLFKAYETSTKQVSRSYHEGIPRHSVKKVKLYH